MADWLLLIPQLMVQLGLLALVLLAGYGARGLFGPSRRDGSALQTFVWTYAIGLALWMLLIALAGLCGLLNRPMLLGLALIVIAAGFHALRREPPALPRLATLRACLAGRFGLARGAVLLYALAIAGLLAVASAAPDTSHDSMWYHLSIPRAWTYSHSIAASPTNMPSNYALGIEALYAALLLFGSEITCSMFYGQITLVLLAAMPMAAASAFGRRAGWIAAALMLTLYCAGMFSIPGYAGNDNAAALFMLLTLLAAAVPRAFPCEAPPTRSLSLRHAALLGLVGGSAAAAKILTAGDMLPFLMLVALAECLRALRRPAPTQDAPIVSIPRGPAFWLVAAGVAALAYAPWALRNLLQGCGNPLFPFGQLLLPFRPDYEAIIRRSAAVNTLFPPTLAGLSEAIRIFPQKFYMFLRANGALTLIIALTSLICLCLRGRFFRIGLALALQILLAFMMSGESLPEIVRYFMLCAPLAIVGVSGCIALLWQRFPTLQRALALGLAAIALGMTFTHVQRQVRWLGYATTHWPGHPVLTQASRYAFVHNKEIGGAIMPLFERVAREIPADQGVLVPDWPYPFYLDRRCIWSCEVSPPILEFSWRGLDAAGAETWMRDHQVAYIVLTSPVRDARLAALIQQGKLIEPIPVQEDGRFSVRLLRLNP